MSKAIPEGWSIRTLDGNICVQSGFPFKSSLFTDDPSLMGIIRIRDLEKQNVETFYAGDYEESYIVKKGDILIGMDGDFNIVKWGVRDALLNQRVCKIEAEPNSNFDTEFLFHSLEEDLTKINAATGATTVKHLSVRDIRGIEKAYPPLPEQQKIATILSSVDDVIEKTRAQIDKLKDLKTGMMQELLTKGIGHTELKDSPVGFVPKQWEIVKFEDVFSDYKYGPRFSSQDYSSCGNVKTIRGTDLSSDGEVHYNQVPTASIDPNTVENHRLRDGDLVMITTAECGSSAVFREQEMPYIASAYAIKLSPTNRVFPEFIKYFMQTPKAMVQIESFIRKGTVANLPGSDVMNIVLALPAYLEQRKIASMLLALDAKITRISQKLAHVKLIKKALMQDLLTGKVRVKPDESAAI